MHSPHTHRKTFGLGVGLERKASEVGIGAPYPGLVPVQLAWQSTLLQVVMVVVVVVVVVSVVVEVVVVVLVESCSSHSYL